MLIDLLYILTLVATFSIAAISLATWLRDTRRLPPLPNFVIRTSDKNVVSSFAMAALFSILAFAIVMLGGYSLNFWSPSATAKRGAIETIVMLALPLFLCAYSIHCAGKRLVVRGDMLEYKKHALSRKRTFYIHEINRIERSAKSNSKIRHASGFDYRFLDKDSKTLFRLDGISTNLNRFWERIYHYSHIQSYYDRRSGTEVAFINKQQEEEILKLIRRRGNSKVPNSFVMSFDKSLAIIFVIGGVFMAVFAVFIMLMLVPDPSRVYGSLIFLGLSLLCFIGFFVIRRQRFIVRDGMLYVLKLVNHKRHQKVIAISDITECRYSGNSSIKLYIGKKRVLSIDRFMSNSEMLLAYLQKKGIPMPDNHIIGIEEQ